MKPGAGCAAHRERRADKSDEVRLRYEHFWECGNILFGGNVKPPTMHSILTPETVCGTNASPPFRRSLHP